MKRFFLFVAFFVFVAFVSPALAQDVTEMIRRWIDLIRIPLRLLLGLGFALTGFWWFKSPEEGRKASAAAFIGILVFFLGFEIVNFLTP